MIYDVTNGYAADRFLFGNWIGSPQIGRYVTLHRILTQNLTNTKLEKNNTAPKPVPTLAARPWYVELNSQIRAPKS